MYLFFIMQEAWVPQSLWKKSIVWAYARLALLGSNNPLEIISTICYVFFYFSSELLCNPQLYYYYWGDFLRKGRNKKNDEKSKYYSNKSFDL